MNPDVMQYLASQQLHDPNQRHSSEDEDDYSNGEDERKAEEDGYSNSEDEYKAIEPVETEEPSSSTNQYRKKWNRFPNQRFFKKYEPKIEVEFTGVEEGHKFDFNSEEINFAFGGRLLRLHTDEEDDVKFEDFIIPSQNRHPKTGYGFFHPTIIDNLKDENIIAMRPAQIATMMTVFYGLPIQTPSPKPADLICISSTGSGKTYAYLAPMIQKCMDKIEADPDTILRTPTVLIFAHSNILAANIYQRAKKLAEETGVKIQSITGGTKPIDSGYFDIGICTIGKFLTHFEDVRDDVPTINTDALEYLVIDEADLLANDNDFRQIVDKIKRDNEISTLLYSATINENVYSLVNEDNAYSFGGGKINQVSAAVKQYFWPVASTALSKITGIFCGKINVGIYAEQELRHPFDALFHFLRTKLFDRSSNKKKVIVFMKRTIVADFTAKKLNIIGFPAVPVHGKQLIRDRQKLLQRFIDGDVRILLATNLLTRGTDIDVEYVINYDLPLDYANWVHRCGRTGRNRKLGIAITFVDKKNTEDYPLLTLQQIAMRADMTNAPPFMIELAKNAKEAENALLNELNEEEEEYGFEP